MPLFAFYSDLRAIFLGLWLFQMTGNKIEFLFISYTRLANRLTLLGLLAITLYDCGNSSFVFLLRNYLVSSP